MCCGEDILTYWILWLPVGGNFLGLDHPRGLGPTLAHGEVFLAFKLQIQLALFLRSVCLPRMLLVSSAPKRVPRPSF